MPPDGLFIAVHTVFLFPLANGKKECMYEYIFKTIFSDGDIVSACVLVFGQSQSDKEGNILTTVG